VYHISQGNGWEPLVTASTNPVTGGISLSAGDIQVLGPTQKHLLIRGMESLTGVTNAATGGTVTATIDTASPVFGGRALKLAFDTTTTQHDVTVSGMNLTNFTAGRGKIVVLAVFDEPRAVSQIQCFVGTDTGFATSMRCDHKLANDGINMSHGVQAITIIPELAAVNNMATTDTVAALRLRFQRSATPIANGVQDLPGSVAASAYATNVWIKGVYLVAPTLPFVLLTFDDASTSWIDLLQPVLAARSIKGTFGVNKNDVGTNDALFINATELQSLYDYGHDISSHNLTNTAYSIATEATYLSDYRTCRDWHYNAGRTRRLDYHPFVQGKFNPALCAAIASEGVKFARTVNDRNFERPLYDYGLHLQLPSRSLGSASSLATAQGWVTQAETRQQDVVIMAHEFAATASSTTTWSISDMTTFLDFCIAEKAAGRIGGIGSLSDYARYIGFER
jgi:peptidoglycan/xylan/chitin deacetylase (PgdA/CDA1 family)